MNKYVSSGGERKFLFLPQQQLEEEPKVFISLKLEKSLNPLSILFN